jgi:hypothetical protein
MSFLLKINTPDSSFIGYSASILLHVIILLLVLVMLNLSDNRARINPTLVQVTPQDLSPDNVRANNQSVLRPKTIRPKENAVNNENISGNGKKTEPAGENSISAFYSLANNNADTTNLDQVYKEATLDLSIKYPSGWTYIDQDLNQKLDGVTFWPSIGNFSPPPYIHLEVKDKDLFSSDRFKYKVKMSGYIIFYNDPEELEEQIEQIFYIRTNSGNDFSLKLVMKGSQEFKSFQPVFFGMLKSFKVGGGIF